MAKTRSNLSPTRIREFARTGAEAALGRLRAEIAAIERAFPELSLPQTRGAVRQSATKAVKRTRKLSAAARKAISARMKRYWAERKKALKKTK